MAGPPVIVRVDVLVLGAGPGREDFHFPEHTLGPAIRRVVLYPPEPPTARGPQERA